MTNYYLYNNDCYFKCPDSYFNDASLDPAACTCKPILLKNFFYFNKRLVYWEFNYLVFFLGILFYFIFYNFQPNLECSSQCNICTSSSTCS